MGQLDPHAGARRYPCHRNESSWPVLVHGRRRGRAGNARARPAEVQNPRRAEAHLVAGNPAGSPAEGPGRPDAPVDRKVREMSTAFFVVRATLSELADRARFDTWYKKEHLPDALKAFGAEAAMRAWSVQDPRVHTAFYR